MPETRRRISPKRRSGQFDGDIQCRSPGSREVVVSMPRAEQLACPQELQSNRLLKRRLIKEWSRIRRRWKRRRFDLRAENDVGRSVHASFDQQRFIGDHCLRGRRAGAPSQSSINLISNKVDAIHHSDFSTNAEYEQVASREVIPWAGRLDDWHRGHQTPKVSFSYWDSRDPSTISKPARVAHGSKLRARAALRSYPCSKTTKSPQASPYYSYFPDSTEIVLGRFTHARLLRFMTALVLPAARCGSTTESSYFRLCVSAWDDVCLQTRTRIPATHASHLGLSLLSFLCFDWKDRPAVAERLAITPNRQRLGPLVLAGESCSSETSRIMALRERVVRECGSLNVRNRRASNARRSQLLKDIRIRQSLLLPGYVPTTPSSPLDLQIVNPGFDDWNHSVVDVHAGLSNVVYRFVLSSWLGISESEANVKAKSLSDSDVVSLSGLLVKLNLEKHQKIIFATRKHSAPLAGLASALDATCTLVSCDVPNHFVFETQKTEGQFFSDFNMGSSSLGAWIYANGSTFSSLHITYCLLKLSQSLPNAFAKNSFSHFLDCDSCRTPFDVVRRFLEFLEASDALDEAVCFASNETISVEVLECVLSDAASKFASFLPTVGERRPVNFSGQSWYLALTSACMLLCSGNRISPSSAHRFPSSASKRGMLGDFIASSQNRNAVSHEIRRRLPKFDVLRAQTARSFGALLVDVGDKEHPASVHLAVSSFLEWSQAVALLLGPKMDHTNLVRVSSIHRRHSVRSTPYETFVAARYRKMLPRNEVLDLLAKALESNPAERVHWVNLAVELGSFGRQVDEESQLACACNDCRHLLPSFRIDHDSRQEPNWWGYNRVQWWDTCLLQLPGLDHVMDAAIPMPGLLENCLDQRAVQRTPGTSSSLLMDTLESLSDDNSDVLSRQTTECPSEEERRENYVNKLPVPFGLGDVEGDQCFEELLNLHPTTEIYVVKLLIRGHLCGLSDRTFERGVRGLATPSSHGSEQAFPYGLNSIALEFLSSKGLNASSILRSAYSPLGSSRPRFAHVWQ